MALIKCPDCGKEFSDQAEACPNCGRPNELRQKSQQAGNSPASSSRPTVTAHENKPKKHSGLSIASFVLSILGCTFVLGVILAIVDLCKKDSTEKHSLSKAALIISAIWIVLAIAVGNSDTSGTENAESNIEITGSVQQTESAVAPETETEIITYIPVTADELASALNSNAMKAEEDYDGKYLEISGKIGIIDSDGKYISINGDEFSLVTIQCYIKSSEQKDVIMNKSVGDSVIVRGKCKDIGEILGYQIDIDSVE